MTINNDDWGGALRFNPTNQQIQIPHIEDVLYILRLRNENLHYEESGWIYRSNCHRVASEVVGQNTRECDFEYVIALQIAAMFRKMS